MPSRSPLWPVWWAISVIAKFFAIKPCVSTRTACGPPGTRARLSALRSTELADALVVPTEAKLGIIGCSSGWAKLIGWGELGVLDPLLPVPVGFALGPAA